MSRNCPQSSPPSLPQVFDAKSEDDLEDVRLTPDGELDMDDEQVPEYSFTDVLIRVCAVTKNRRPPRDFVIIAARPTYLPADWHEEQIRVFMDPPEPVPTRTRPGTADRITDYAERYRRRQALHHKKDAGESLRHAREIRVAPNGRPIVVAEVEETYQGMRRTGAAAQVDEVSQVIERPSSRHSDAQLAEWVKHVRQAS